MSEFADRAMMVKVSIHGWTAKKKDREVSDEIAEQKNAIPTAGKYTAHLVSSPYLEQYRTACNNVRLFHYRHTSPWLDGAWRLLAARMFGEYREGIVKIRKEAIKYGHEFLDKDYAEAIQRAKKERGDMFKEKDYPSPAALKDRFGIDVSFMPIPEANDWRVQLGDKIENEIKQDIASRMKHAEEVAMRDLWERLHESLTKFHDRLANDKRLRVALFDNLSELVDILPKMNISGDKHLDKLTEEVRLKLCSVAREDIKKDEALRAQQAKATEEILDKMSAYIGSK